MLDHTASREGAAGILRGMGRGVDVKESRKGHCFRELGGHRQPLKQEHQHRHPDEGWMEINQGASWGRRN